MHIAMKFCDADACHSCPAAVDMPCCLRRKAQFCLWLAGSRSAPSIRGALETMSLRLMEDAEALEREAAALPIAR
jgi:hypothetical protein